MWMDISFQHSKGATPVDTLTPVPGKGRFGEQFLQDRSQCFALSLASAVSIPHCQGGGHRGMSAVFTGEAGGLRRGLRPILPRLGGGTRGVSLVMPNRRPGMTMELQLTDEERSALGYKHFVSIREKLENGASFKNANSADFYASQIRRFNVRYEKTYVSKRQLKWLRDIDKRGLTKGRKEQ